MNSEFGLKELYEVSLKATYPIEVGGRIVESGEKIAIFDNIQIADFIELKKFVSANGGFDNRPWVWWEETKEIKFTITQGVFSKAQLALMTNAKFVSSEEGKAVLVSRREQLESDENGIIKTKFAISKPVFVYDVQTGDKITDFTFENNEIYIKEKYREVFVDYTYEYNNNYQTITFGQALTNGFLSLEGKMRVKDDITGQIKTGIVTIPKLKLLSNLSMRLGRDAIPQVGKIDAVAIPVGTKGQKKVMEIIFLDDDIDSDI